MPINLSGDLRFDTRGLPEGYDPHKLYEYRYETLVKNPSSAFESFLYKYIPFSVIKSFAFAIDPTAPFKVAPGAITPASRIKWRQTASVLQRRKWSKNTSNLNWAQKPNYGGVSNCWDPALDFTSSNPTPQSGLLGSQDPLADYIKDTTARTRLVGSDQGELELFKGYLFSPARTVRNGSSNQTIYPHDGPVDPGCAARGGSLNLVSGGYNYVTESVSAGGRLSKATYDGLRSSEIAFAKALCQKHAIQMLKGWSPFQRDYSLFRNVVELKDMPRSILSLQQTVLDFRKLFVSLGTQPSLRRSIFDLRKVASDLPSEYLSFHFGWKQTFNDLMDLLVLPNKMAKKYNFLIKRNGLPTTFRVKRNILSAEKDVSGFQYDVFGPEYGAVLGTRLERESELRLVVNATFDFPPINTPQFRVKEFLDRIGAVPRATDIYNLIPWTWLVDYFTGFGNYVECIDNINHDSSLVNWGMITCRTHGKLITEFRSKSDFVRTDSVFGVSSTVKTTTVGNNHTSILNYECQTRSDVAQVLSVKTTSVPSSLTTYQKSIIGALLAQRAEFGRRKPFRFT